jgi:hypothetical protein
VASALWVAALFRFASSCAGFEPCIRRFRTFNAQSYQFSAIGPISDSFRQRVPGFHHFIDIDSLFDGLLEAVDAMTKTLPATVDCDSGIQQFHDRVDPGTWLKPGA